MMVFRGAVLVLIVFVNFCEIYSAPAEVDNSQTQILYNEYNLNPDGNYNYKVHFRYKLSDRQAVDVEGKLNDVGGSPIYKVNGLYTFEGTDGNVYTINYVPDENGYRTGSEKSAATITPTTRRPTSRKPTYPATSLKPPLPPIRPGDEGEINSKTIAGTFG